MTIAEIKYRLKMSFSVLFGKNTMILVEIEKKEIGKILEGYKPSLRIKSIKANQYLTMLVLQTSTYWFDDIDLALERAKFEAEFELSNQKE